MATFGRLEQLLRERRTTALITVVKTQGSTPRKAGARMIVFEDGSTEGSIGGGVVEHRAIKVAKEVLHNETPRLVDYKLTNELAMCCGGQMTLFVEPLVQSPLLFVFGCGHVGTALIRTAQSAGFDIIAIDELESNANPNRLPEASRILQSYERADLETLPFAQDVFVVIATREHALDQKLLEYCLKKPTCYVGVIGSLRKARMQLERLRAKGYENEQLEGIRCPIGLDIGALTPEEIAVSVVAELIQHRRGGPRFASR